MCSSGAVVSVWLYRLCLSEAQMLGAQCSVPLKPCVAFLESPYHSKPRKVASWRSLRTAASMPLGGRMSLTPQKLCLGSSKQGTHAPLGNRPLLKKKKRNRAILLTSSAWSQVLTTQSLECALSE